MSTEKGVDCGVSAGSEARADSVRASVRATLVSMGVSASMWIPLVGVGVGAGAPCGVTVGSDRSCEVGSVVILWLPAAGAAVRGLEGLLVVSIGEEPEGRQRRLAAWASSAEDTASCCETGMAWKHTGTELDWEETWGNHSRFILYTTHSVR